MKMSRIVWIVIAVVFAGLIAWRVASVRKTRQAMERPAEEETLVEVVRVGRADVMETLTFTGNIRPRNEVEIFAKVPGRVETVAAQVGDRVKAGQVLATLEHKEIAWQARASQAALQVARANQAGAQLNFERTRKLFEGGSAPQAQMDQAKVQLSLAEAQVAQAEAAAGLANQQVANARVESPIAGVVTRRLPNVGSQVGPQQPIFTVQDSSALKLETAVDASAYARLQKGKQAQVTVDALPGQVFAGQVTLMSPSLDPQTRRALVELEIDNAAGRLLPNMFAHAKVSLGELPNALVVPRAAVVEAAGGAVVYRIKDGAAEAVRPQLGPQDGERIVVREGLAEGDAIAITAVSTLSHGSRVKVAPGAQATPTRTTP